MSSIEKEFDTRGSKKSKLKLSIKLPSLRSRSTSSPLERSTSTGAEFPERSGLRRIKEENDKEDSSDSSDDSYDSEEEMKKYRQGGRRRSLSTSAMDDNRSDGSADEEDSGKSRGDSVSLPPTPFSKTRPDSPTVSPLLSPKSCLRHQTRRRSTSMSEVEDILACVQKLKSVHFSPDTVDPPERPCKYREYCERKLGLKRCNTPNVKHELHKQHMKQLKKVNLSDYMSGQNKGYKSGPMFSPMAGAGGMMMM